MSNALRPSGKASLALRAGIVLATALVGGIWLVLQGPFPAIRITTALPEAAPFWYMVLAFPVLGILMADLMDLYLSEGISRSTLELAVQIGILVLLSSARLSMRLPLSGHSLLVSYFIFRRLLLRPARRRRASVELWLGIAISGAIAYPKLAWWNDPVTLLSGVALGAILATAGRWMAR